MSTLGPVPSPAGGGPGEAVTGMPTWSVQVKVSIAAYSSIGRVLVPLLLILAYAS